MHHYICDKNYYDNENVIFLELFIFFFSDLKKNRFICMANYHLLLVNHYYIALIKNQSCYNF